MDSNSEKNDVDRDKDNELDALAQQELLKLTRQYRVYEYEKMIFLKYF